MEVVKLEAQHPTINNLEVNIQSSFTQVKKKFFVGKYSKPKMDLLLLESFTRFSDKDSLSLVAG